MKGIQAVDRDKFVVRFDDNETRSKVQAASAIDHTSMNTFILQAIDEKLARGARIDKLLDLAAMQLNK